MMERREESKPQLDAVIKKSIKIAFKSNPWLIWAANISAKMCVDAIKWQIGFWPIQSRRSKKVCGENFRNSFTNKFACSWSGTYPTIAAYHNAHQKWASMKTVRINFQFSENVFIKFVQTVEKRSVLKWSFSIIWWCYNSRCLYAQLK